MLIGSEYSDVFSHLGNAPVPASDDVVIIIKKFTCELCGIPKLRNVDSARCAKFQIKYAPKKKEKHLDKIKGTDSSSMPLYVENTVLQEL